LSGALATLGALLRLGRPLFLVGGFVMYGIGAAVAVLHGHAVDLRLYLLGQAAVTAFQLMTHYANDYFDYEADRANATPTKWSGGSRVLVRGELPRRAALAAALVLALAGLAAAWALGASGRAGPAAVPLLLAILVLSWEYSAPPLRLHSTGLGELDTAVVVTGLVPLLGFYLQAPDWAGLRVLLLAIAPLCCLQVAMLLAIEFPDQAGDAAVGKRTLVVRLGASRGAALYAAVVAAAYGALPALAAAGLPTTVALAAALPAPLAAWRLLRMRADFARAGQWERITFWAVALLVATSTAELGALVIAGGHRG
jgi:1,4-dihydroxy-2-naphthoate octaprenyltransferase